MKRSPHSLGGGEADNRQGLGAEGRGEWLTRLRGDAMVRGMARDVVLSWRRLTEGARRAGSRGRSRGGYSLRRTVIACSGGADSSALVIALAAGLGARAREVLVVGHVVHDLRERGEALADRDAARELAGRLGLDFAEREVRVRGEGGEKGNLEALARRARYAALGEMALEAGCGFVATAHHADDQMESVLMALVRGAGLRGLAGIRVKRGIGVVSTEGTPPRERPSAARVTLIRPALGVTRGWCRGICERTGWEWREDATNADESRLRAAIRARVVPMLEAMRPGASVRAASAARAVRGAAGLEAARVRGALALARREGEGGVRFEWARSDLRGMRSSEVAALLRGGVRVVAGAGGHGMDRVGVRGVAAVVRCVRSAGTERKEFVLGAARVRVMARRVVVEGRGED